MKKAVFFSAVKSVLYLAVTGALAFWLGRLLPKGWFHYDRFPYRAFAFEREGRVYHRIGIRWWKEKLPDMSRIFPRLITSKRLPPAASAARIEEMLQETCIAEFIHVLLCITGFGVLFLWKGAGGWSVYMLYLFGNIPYCLIQRYNRPKLARIHSRQTEKEAKEAEK